jgi:hypothetical protein
MYSERETPGKPVVSDRSTDNFETGYLHNDIDGSGVDQTTGTLGGIAVGTRPDKEHGGWIGMRRKKETDGKRPTNTAEQKHLEPIHSPFSL